MFLPEQNQHRHHGHQGYDGHYGHHRDPGHHIVKAMTNITAVNTITDITNTLNIIDQCHRGYHYHQRRQRPDKQALSLGLFYQYLRTVGLDPEKTFIKSKGQRKIFSDIERKLCHFFYFVMLQSLYV